MTVPPTDVLRVNWNGGFFLRHFLPLTLRFTEVPHQISIWDNGSRDDSRGLLSLYSKAFPERVRVYRSRRNVGHGQALENLLNETSREYVVFLDCDAVPLRSGWIADLRGPVLGGAAACGVPHLNLDFLHPSCLCTTRTELADLGVDIQPNYSVAENGEWTQDWRDVLEDLTRKAHAHGRALATIPSDGDFLFDGFGRTYGDGMLYHHWFGTRLSPHGGLSEVEGGRSRERLRASQASLQEWMTGRELWVDGMDPGGARGRWHYLAGCALGRLGL